MKKKERVQKNRQKKGRERENTKKFNCFNCYELKSSISKAFPNSPDIALAMSGFIGFCYKCLSINNKIFRVLDGPRVGLNVCHME